jgi:protein ImuB
MPRVMTIWLPRWPVQRRLLDRPELRKLPVFICRRERRGLLTVASWAWAEPPRRRQAAIRPGMSLAEAMSVLALAYGSRACHVAEVDTDDPAADLAALEQLARWCRRFAATVGIEQPPAGLAEAATAPECLLLDVTGTAGFFGGEAALARTAAWTLAARRLHARVAIADTPAASWAAAHHTNLVARAEHGSPATAGGAGRLHLPQAAAGPHRRWAIAAPGSQHLRAGAGAVLAGLPLESLRLERTVCDMLHEVGIDTLGGMLRLSAKSLAARFPPSLARRLAEFTGARAEPIISPRGGELPQATHDFDLPLPLTAIDDAGIASLLEQLVGQCIPPLAARGEGILTVQTRFEPAAAAAGAGSLPPAVIDISLFRPSMSVRHVVELIRLRMGRAKLPREIAAISVEVVAAGLAGCRQRSLFDAGSGEQPGGSAGAHVDVGQLIDRLAGRLGRPAVFEPKPVADPQPEHAWLPQPPHGAGNGRSRPATPPGRRTASVAVHVRPAAEGLPRNRVRRQGVATRSGFAATGRRPIWMPPRPLPLEPLAAGMVSVAPDGPPVRFRFGGVVHRVMQAHGPERIETAWWRGPTVRRDYYIVETESGARFWLFRRLGRPPRKARGEWYLHGVFA